MIKVVFHTEGEGRDGIRPGIERGLWAAGLGPSVTVSVRLVSHQSLSPRKKLKVAGELSKLLNSEHQAFNAKFMLPLCWV